MRAEIMFIALIFGELSLFGMIDTKVKKDNCIEKTDYKSTDIQQNDIFDEKQWVENYSVWENAFQKVISGGQGGSLLNPNSYLNLFNRKMNRFFRFYEGKWSSDNFDSAISKLKGATSDITLDEVSKCALNGIIKALRITKTIDFSKNED